MAASRSSVDALISQNFDKAPLKIFQTQGLIMFSRLGVYLRLPGVDVERFSEAMQGSGLLGYIDTLSGTVHAGQ